MGQRVVRHRQDGDQYRIEGCKQLQISIVVRDTDRKIPYVLTVDAPDSLQTDSYQTLTSDQLAQATEQILAQYVRAIGPKNIYCLPYGTGTIEMIDIDKIVVIRTVDMDSQKTDR